MCPGVSQSHCTATGKIQQWESALKLLQVVCEYGLACFPMAGLRSRSPSLWMERRFRELGFLSLVKRRLWWFFTAAFQYLKEAYKKTGTEILEGPFAIGQRVIISTRGALIRLTIRKHFPRSDWMVLRAIWSSWRSFYLWGYKQQNTWRGWWFKEPLRSAFQIKLFYANSRVLTHPINFFCLSKHSPSLHLFFLGIIIATLSTFPGPPPQAQPTLPSLFA